MRRVKFIIDKIGLSELAVLTLFSIVGLASWINTIINDNDEIVEASAQECPFIKVYKNYDYEVIYHKDSKVMYVKESNDGIFTLLVNPDGTPMIYEEE